MELLVITPKQTMLELDDADSVLLPGEAGEIGVLPGHIAMFTGLTIGLMEVEAASKSTRLALSGGFAEVLDDRITVLADAAERAENIDVQRALAARRRAEERLASRAEDIDIRRARSALARAVNRLQVAGHTD